MLLSLDLSPALGSSYDWASYQRDQKLENGKSQTSDRLHIDQFLSSSDVSQLSIVLLHRPPVGGEE